MLRLIRAPSWPLTSSPRITREAASLAAAMEGFDSLVFTAGIGENDDIVAPMFASSWNGSALKSTSKRTPSARVNRARFRPRTTRVSVWVIPTNEELMIARAAVKQLA